MKQAILTVSHPLADGNPPDWASEWGQDKHGVFVGFTVAGVTQRLRWIAPGRFLMGSLDLLEAASEFFGLTLPQARAIIKEVATVTATWRETANS